MIQAAIKIKKLAVGHVQAIHVIKSKSKIFSINSFSIFSFYEKDHGYRDGRSIDEFIKDKLKSHNVKYNKLKISKLKIP